MKACCSVSRKDLKAKHSLELKELDGPKVFRQKVCGIFITIDEIEFGEFMRYDFTDIMVANVNMLRSIFGNWVRGDKNRALVITADWDRTEAVAELPQKGMHPDYLAATIGERHVFCLGAGEGNCLLRSGCPANESFCHFDKVSRLGTSGDVI